MSRSILLSNVLPNGEKMPFSYHATITSLQARIGRDVREALREIRQSDGRYSVTVLDTGYFWKRKQFELFLVQTTQKREELAEKRVTVIDVDCPTAVEGDDSVQPMEEIRDKVLRSYLENRTAPTRVNRGPERTVPSVVFSEVRSIMLGLHGQLQKKLESSPFGKDPPQLSRVLLVLAGLNQPGVLEPWIVAFCRALEACHGLSELTQRESSRCESLESSKASAAPSVLSTAATVLHFAIVTNETSSSEVMIRDKGVEYQLHTTAKIELRRSGTAETDIGTQVKERAAAAARDGSQEIPLKYILKVTLNWIEPIEDDSWSMNSTRDWLSRFLPGQPAEPSGDPLINVLLTKEA